eukprot:TRINITY_DN74934_c0_g1_i1.p1 TRINITY_DN74934_c0_g1~~TRINITY_DN74934_c0_g1_i1.p1  ORF type:complete len:364 (-),score=43.24 TRINITY_DN74934_c0_g1_i1:60-1151(-)
MEDSVDVGESLSCFEYVNSKGEIKHVLQLFCECNDFDSLVDGLVSGKRPEPGRIDKVLADIDDRMRIPWPVDRGGVGGALHLGLPGLLPPVLLSIVTFVSTRSFAGLLLGVAGLPPLAFFAHQRLMRLKRRNSFFLSWTLHSIAFGLVSYMYCFSESIQPEANILIFALCGLSVICLARTMSGPIILPVDADATTQQKARAHRCAISRDIVAGYDHYCVWVGSSIGRGNHRAYLCFVASIFATCVGAGLCVLRNLSVCPAQMVAAAELAENSPAEDQWIGLTASVSACATSNESSFALAFVAYMAVVAVGVGALFIQQGSLISAGLTGYERRHASRIQGVRCRIPKHRGFVGHWVDFCFAATD